MATLNADALDDLTELTFNRVVKRKHWTDISLDRQEHCIASRYIDAEKMPVKGTPKNIWKVQVRNQSTFRYTGLFSKDQYDVQNLMVGAEQPWAICTANYSYDEGEESFQGSDFETIVDEIAVREHSMYSEFWDGLETSFWTQPSSDTQDPRPLSGLPHWIQKNATEGFNGGNPSGFSSGAGGVSSSTYPNWSNWTFDYDTVSRDDFVAKLIKAAMFTKFKSPHSYKSNDGDGKEPDWQFYTTWDVLEALHQFLDSRNDNLRDVAGMASGGAPFMGIPFKWVPALSNSGDEAVDTSDPVYGVNWKSMHFVFQKGWDMRRKTTQHPYQHNVRVKHCDSKLQLFNTSRRSNFIGYVAT